MLHQAAMVAMAPPGELGPPTPECLQMDRHTLTHTLILAHTQALTIVLTHTLSHMLNWFFKLIALYLSARPIWSWEQVDRASSFSAAILELLIISL